MSSVMDRVGAGAMVGANSRQVGGGHYKGQEIEPWDYIAANGLGFFEGNVVKYVSRWQDKGGVEDLKKARHYLDKLIEVKEQEELPVYFVGSQG